MNDSDFLEISINLVHEGGTNSETSFFRLRIVSSVIIFMNIYIRSGTNKPSQNYRLMKCEYEANFIQISGTLLAVKEKHFRTQARRTHMLYQMHYKVML